jgi:hypothetical protein
MDSPLPGGLEIRPSDAVSSRMAAGYATNVSNNPTKTGSGHGHGSTQSASSGSGGGGSGEPGLAAAKPTEKGCMDDRGGMETSSSQAAHMATAPGVAGSQRDGSAGFGTGSGTGSGTGAAIWTRDRGGSRVRLEPLFTYQWYQNN